MKLVTMILTAILAASVLLLGCKLHQQEPVAQQKSIGRILDEASKSMKYKFRTSLTNYAERTTSLISWGKRNKGLREDQLRELAAITVAGGSKAINSFKMAGIRKTFSNFAEINSEIAYRVDTHLDAIDPVTLKYIGPYQRGVTDQDYVARRLKELTNIEDDKILARLVEQQGKNLDDLAEAVATNHRLADAVGAEIASDGSHYGLKSLDITPEQMTSELKVSFEDLGIDRLDGITNGNNATTSYGFLQEITGVDVYDEASVLDLLLRRGNDGKFAYEALSADEIKKLGNPFDKKLTNPLRGVVESKHWRSDHLRKFFKDS